ncbi:hypothetical protein AL539_12085 [Vibrio alginolyticus]|nr:hypothetical protein AL539_12085 [Vibrio alginolyticus]GAK18010.1 hypothetical protein JCM19053_2746 [Vibrio sp. JCM 19053]
MYGDDGQLTEFAIQCHHYFNELKRAAEQKSAKRSNRSATKSAKNHELSSLALNQGVLKHL